MQWRWDWVYTTLDAALMVVVTTLVIYLMIILMTKLFGVRSFSKLSSFDFAMTVAIGSLFASTILSRDPPIAQATLALIAMYGFQWSIAKLRKLSPLNDLVDNRPILLMLDGQFLHKNMSKARVTEGDIFSKLREANVFSLEEARAVTMETSGDISVLSGRPDERTLSPEILTGVRGADLLEARREG